MLVLMDIPRLAESGVFCFSVAKLSRTSRRQSSDSLCRSSLEGVFATPKKRLMPSGILIRQENVDNVSTTSRERFLFAIFVAFYTRRCRLGRFVKSRSGKAALGLADAYPSHLTSGS